MKAKPLGQRGTIRCECGHMDALHRTWEAPGMQSCRADCPCEQFQKKAGAMSAETVDCECGEITGTRCAWSGPPSETVTLEYMPKYLRASHVEAENRGVYPHNGAMHLRVERSCAEGLCDEWTEVVS